MEKVKNHENRESHRMNLETILKRIPNPTPEEQQWLIETTEKAENWDKFYSQKYRLICHENLARLTQDSKELKQLKKKPPTPKTNTQPCGPKCPNHWEIDCDRNPDSFIPCQLPHRNPLNQQQWTRTTSEWHHYTRQPPNKQN